VETFFSLLAPVFWNVPHVEATSVQHRMSPVRSSAAWVLFYSSQSCS